MAKQPGVGAAPKEDKDALPPKENALFRSIVKHYDAKQYKKGVKAADAVLKCVCVCVCGERGRGRGVRACGWAGG